MNYLKLKISRLSFQLDISGLRSELCDRLTEQFHFFLNSNGDTPNETIHIIHVKTRKWYRIDPCVINLIRNNIKKASEKFPFSGNSDQEIDEKIKDIFPVFGDRKFQSILKEIKNPDDIIVFPVKRGCLIKDPNSSETHLFLLTRLFKGISISSISDAIYFTSAMALPSLDCIMLHGVGIKDGEKGYLFLGLSGSGKTTVAGLSSGKDIISDDGLILERQGFKFSMSTSPIDQSSINIERSKENVCRKSDISVGFLLVKDNQNFLEKLLPADVCSIILKNHIHYFRYFSFKSIEKTFNLISDLCRHVPFYGLHFKKDASFWRSIEDEMSCLPRIEETYNGFR